MPPVRPLVGLDLLHGLVVFRWPTGLMEGRMAHVNFT
jgi:hypothetical protein